MNRSDRLLFLGTLLFLLGLLIGLFIPLFQNPRMGLSAHLEGLMNGLYLVVLGLIWTKLTLPPRWLTVTYWLTIYGAFANLTAVTVAAITGAGRMMPIAGGQEGPFLIETLISFLLVSLSLAMIGAVSLVLVGLYRR
jgi:hydroxylaminobenzene mutase